MTKERKPTKLTRKERELLALLCRIVRQTGIFVEEDVEHSARLKNAEYDVREHWNLER